MGGIMKKQSIIIALFLLLCASQAWAVMPNMWVKGMKDKRMKVWVDSVMSTMSLDEQIGQLFMVTADVSLTKKNMDKLAGYVKEQKIGGILFSKATVDNQVKLTNFLQEQARIPLFIALDGEWGLSMRIEGSPRFPKNMALGATKDNRQIYEYGQLVGLQCREMGIHINFAPVLDINNNPNNPVINVRSFGENREQVALAAMAYARGLESAGVLSVGKHFPGHGDTSTDSHYGLPVLDLSLSRIDSIELYPFKKYIERGFAGMMVGHLYLPAFDRDTIPASLSRSVVADLLKNELGFEGLIFTDALVMRAIDLKGESACVKAIQAGVDVLLSPQFPVVEYNAVKSAVENRVISTMQIERRCRKILSYKYICGLSEYKPIDSRGVAARLNNRRTEVNIRKMTKESVTLLKNKNNHIPLRNSALQSVAVINVGDNQSTFQNTIQNYTPFELFTINSETDYAQLERMVRRLKDYNTLVAAIYTDNEEVVEPFLRLVSMLDKKTDLSLSFFLSPYRIKSYLPAINSAKSILLAYENTVSTQFYAAQMLLGGVATVGKLPVSIDSLYTFGSGIRTQVCRLGYDYPEMVDVDSKKMIEIDSLVMKAIAEKALPGCQVLVAKEGTVIFNKQYGNFDYTNAHPVTESDIYDLSSLTNVAATLPAMMMLYDDGKYLLRDKIGQFIPALKSSEKYLITVKEALFHQSGLPANIPFYQMLYDKKSYKGALVSKHKSATYSIQIDEDLFVNGKARFRKEWLSSEKSENYPVEIAAGLYLNKAFYSEMFTRFLKTKPGSKEKYVYSDLNFMLLRLMIEDLADMKLDSMLSTTLYSKLGANTTGFLPLKRFPKTSIAPTENDQFFRRQLLIGYPHDELAALSGGVEGNAGLFSNANDLAKLCQMYLNEGTYGGEQLIQSETVRMFTQMKSPDSRRGLGFDRPNPMKPSNGPASDWAPLSAYGHTGSTGTCFWVDPENKLIYIFLSNRIYPSRLNREWDHRDLRTEIQDIIYKSIIQNKN